MSCRIVIAFCILFFMVSMGISRTNTLQGGDYVRAVVSFDTCVHLTMYDLKFKQDTLIMCFPKTISGTYHYIPTKIRNFQAFDSNGNKLKYDKNGNKFIIYDSRDIGYIEYESLISETSTKNILSSGVIVDSSLIVMNNNVLFGEFGTDQAYSIEIRKPKHFENISIQNCERVNDSIDIVMFDNYTDLINYPVVYSSKSSSCFFDVDSTRINIYVHSPTQAIKAVELLKYIKPAVLAVLKEIEFVKPKDYSIVLLFNDKIDKKRISMSALEHPNSSVYTFYSEPLFFDEKDSLQFVRKLQRFIVHEMFHIFTPINFKDEYIEAVFIDTLKMSSHLWLYEGFVEYHTYRTLLKHGLIGIDCFFEIMEGKIRGNNILKQMKYNVSLASASENIYNRNDLSVFYSRAVSLCLAFDILIIELTKGEKTLFSIMKDFYDKKPNFIADSLFRDMKQQIPGIGNFIDNYIVGNNYPDFSIYLKKAGLKYELGFPDNFFYFPISIIKSDDMKKSVVVEFSEKLYPFEKEQQIEIVKINGLPVSAYSFSIFDYHFSQARLVNIEYYEKGNYRKAFLQSIAGDIPKVPYYPKISLLENITSSQNYVLNKLVK